MPSGVETKEVVFLLVGLAGGLVGGYFTNQYFFKKQAKTADISEANIHRLLELTYEQSLRNGVKDATIVAALRSAEAKFESLSDLVEIKARMDQIIATLNSSVDRSNLSTSLVFDYKALGDRWSQLATVKLDLRIMTPDNRMEIDRFRAAHESIFPSGYPGAGEFRKENVHIIDTMGTVARIVDLTSVQTTLQTVPPEKVEKNVRELFDYWNSRAPTLPQENSEAKISEISRFHHELEMIHPFLDGNGRIGRIILEEQIAYAFGIPIKFRPERDDYYRALRALDLGSSGPLEALIRKALQQFNVALGHRTSLPTRFQRKRPNNRSEPC